MVKLPKEFIKLNELVKEFNNSISSYRIYDADQSQRRYLLLQGSKVKGYSLSIFEKVNLYEGRLIHTIINGNKKTIEDAIWVLNGLKHSYFKK